MNLTSDRSISLGRRTLLAAGAAASLAAPAWAATPAPVAATKAGRVRGYVDTGVSGFRGIPYGASTAGRRFQPPLPAPAWKGVRETTAYGPASPQSKAGEPTSEDCLYLNVWTPGLDRARRPVMVYVHGGAYAHGSGSDPLYDGVRLARRGDVVVVTLNHRLNAFGHLYLAKLGGPAYADSGNVGLMDLVQALTWVRDNIAAFGGDPDCVTLFGQSGGGAKIASLMSMPAAKGLFHRAATMSGQQVTAQGPRGATARARAFMEALKLKPEQVGELATLPYERLVEGLSARDPIAGGLYFGPVQDERSLSRHPFWPDAPAISAGVPMIIGNTRGETRNLIGGSDPSLFALSWDELPARLQPALFVDIDAETVIAEYRRLYPAYSPSDVFFAATTAGRSWRGALIELEARAAQGAPTWAYQLDWGSPIDGGKWGAPHMLDIPLVFGTTAAPNALSGDGVEARHMSELMTDAFIAFARTGDPRTPAVPEWPRYGLERRTTLSFDLAPRPVDDPRGDERRLFAKVPYVQTGTL
ncbi:carboxylesterase/lipase family protein [Caulobacter sp. 17J80-11]|uniref:carboxylesterase/lipase family protein n=1 Tax=Caulobacter sp. 17J80-11 TaxID=2763502 RepID=UPI00351C104A